MGRRAVNLRSCTLRTLAGTQSVPRDEAKEKGEICDRKYCLVFLSSFGPVFGLFFLHYALFLK